MSNTNFNFNSDKDSLIMLNLSPELREENIVTTFLAKKNSNKGAGGGFITLELNHIYKKKTIVSDIYHDSWTKTINTFKKRTKEKGMRQKHIDMITDVLDNNAGKIIPIFQQSVEANEDVQAATAKDHAIASALNMVKKMTVELFLDEVKKPFIAIKQEDHTETMAIESKTFTDWLTGTFYFYHKNKNDKKSPSEIDDSDLHNHSNDTVEVARVLNNDEVSKVQSILTFETNKIAKIKTLYLRAASFIETGPLADPDSNAVYYDLCNPKWQIVKITQNGWSIENNYPQILFKRFMIMNPQVEPKRDYPLDILEQFMKLTNVYNDEDNKLLAQVYMVSLFLLADLPKPIMIPHGTQGSGKSTFQEFVKQTVDPAAALTTAFPRDIAELVQQLSHTYLTFFDNVSEISQLNSDALCRAVTGSGFHKRVLYENDEDFIYNMKRAVGFNGINITASKPDLLERILNLHLQPIDKRKRRKIKDLQNEFEIILAQLLGYIFDIIVKVLSRIGEVKLEELPRMADFAEMGELIARCLGYPEGKFTETYNRNIGFTNEEAIESNPIATAITNLMDIHPTWTGKASDLKITLDELVSSKKDLASMMHTQNWPKTPRALVERVNEVIPNLKEIDIVIHFDKDLHTKNRVITIVNNNFTIPSNDGGDRGNEETFWSIYSELEKQEKEDPSNMSTDDKDTVSRSKLQEALVSSGEFYVAGANRIISDMVKAGKLKEVSYDTYRRVEKKIK